MSKKKTVSNNKEIINQPQNYAAIYARISSQKDNNSIHAQIKKAKEALAKKNLLVYAVYTDKVSGLTVRPADRKGFGQLIEDAKDGCFKTIIAYRHDRIVRCLSHWTELKHQMTKLGIKITFSDESEYCSDNSTQGDFLENLLVMVSELEPNNISERALGGQHVRRQQGVYNAGANDPFGYKRIDVSLNIGSHNNKKVNYKSKFIKVSIKDAIIYYIFEKCKVFIEKENFDIQNIQNDTYNFICLLINNLTVSKLEQLRVSINDNMKAFVIESVLRELKKFELLERDKYQEQISTLMEKLEDSKNYISNKSNLEYILKNPIYGGFILIKANQKNKGIINENSKTKLDLDSFAQTINIQGIASFEAFEKVYCYMHISSLLKAEEPEYLFKGKLKCGVCGRYMHLTDHLIQCPADNRKKLCVPFVKTNLIESILEIIIDEVFEKSDTGFNRFEKLIEDKIEQLSSEIENTRKQKMLNMKEYILSKNEKNKMDILSQQENINSNLEKVASHRRKLGYLNSLKSLINSYIKSHDLNISSQNMIDHVKSCIISHIISNQDILQSTFSEVIKEIRVSMNDGNKQTKCKISLQYEFAYQSNCDIFKSIH
jgi:DNA invertase Pin-like site-specific DNA recombinase